MFQTYYQLTKPGIIYGNALTAAAGFFLASRWHASFRLFVATLLGTCLVIASACVFNNYIDRGLDTKMARTKKRALASGLVSVRSVIIYASVLGIMGFSLLVLYTNVRVVAIGIVAFIDYVILYGVAKRRSVHGTLVGSIAGAAPILAGYVAVTDRFDGGALILFLLLACWQMPHFYAIAMYRFKDYKAAGLPVLPVHRGLATTKRQVIAYVMAFNLAVVALTVFGYAGYWYLVIVLLASLSWLGLGLRGFTTTDDKHWARQMFFCSLVVIMVLSIMLALGKVLP